MNARLETELTLPSPPRGTRGQRQPGQAANPPGTIRATDYPTFPAASRRRRPGPRHFLPVERCYDGHQSVIGAIGGLAGAGHVNVCRIERLLGRGRPDRELWADSCALRDRRVDVASWSAVVRLPCTTTRSQAARLRTPRGQHQCRAIGSLRVVCRACAPSGVRCQAFGAQLPGSPSLRISSED